MMSTSLNIQTKDSASNAEDIETLIASNCCFRNICNILGCIEDSCQDCNLNNNVEAEDKQRQHTATETQWLLCRSKLITIQAAEDIFQLSCNPTWTKHDEKKCWASNDNCDENKVTLCKKYPVLQEKNTNQLSRKAPEIKNESTKRVPKRQIYCKSCGSQYSERSRSALHFIKLVILLFWLSFVACENVNVTWDMKLNIVMFGTTEKLTCRIRKPTNLCQTFYIQWYGGQSHKLLCRNTACRNPEKYSLVKETGCSFTLKIYNFSASDVNCDYSCYYGNSYQRKRLALDELHFAYVPNTQDILQRNKTVSNLTDLVKYFQVVIELTKVYPVPVCNITFQEENISRFVDILKRNNGIFYSLIFNISYSPSKCSGQFKMQCEIGNALIIPYKENVNLCLGNENETQHVFPTILVIGVGFGAIFVLVFSIIIVAVVWRKRRSSKENRGDILYGNLVSSGSNNDQGFEEQKGNGTCGTVT